MTDEERAEYARSEECEDCGGHIDDVGPLQDDGLCGGCRKCWYCDADFVDERVSHHAGKYVKVCQQCLEDLEQGEELDRKYQAILDGSVRR